jgi:hypothetical protein
MYLIATKPGRTTRKYKNAVQKFARVQPNGKFKWVTSAADATVFKSMPDVLYALQIRAQELEGGPTRDLTIADAQVSTVQVGRFYNGG